MCNKPTLTYRRGTSSSALCVIIYMEDLFFICIKEYVNIFILPCVRLFRYFYFFFVSLLVYELLSCGSTLWLKEVKLLSYFKMCPLCLQGTYVNSWWLCFLDNHNNMYLFYHLIGCSHFLSWRANMAWKVSFTVFVCVGLSYFLDNLPSVIL